MSMEKLKQLKEIYEMGMIGSEEFERQKNALLAEMGFGVQVEQSRAAPKSP